ncbi:hypothetical protein CHS0354_003527 [Potamilus streckersoni]|uniref:Protein kinase domain-containing protein n=1 Tax=Potamilus streckersoni TaxID=2493646 RepID=A0AAE0SAN9_9BIVA|nr:hypothetical protein CHS0354_003527 [Potamilus streckersoni]
MTTSIEEIRYRQLLQGLAADLTSDEVSQMVFLLRFHIKGKKARSEIKSEATKLLTELEKMDCIGVDNLTLLVELFELIGRTDLKNRIADDLGHSYQASKHVINEFMRTLWKFGLKLDSDDLKNAKFLLGWNRDKEIIEVVWQLFEKAFERGLLEEDKFASINGFAERINQIETLKSVMKQDPFIYKGSNYNPGNTSTSGMSQEEYPYRRVGVTPRQEERPTSQNCPYIHKHQHLPPYVGIDPWQYQGNNQYLHQISVLHEDDMSISLSAAINNPHSEKHLPFPLTPENRASNIGVKTDPYFWLMPPVEILQKQDASAGQKEAVHESHVKDVEKHNASLKLFEPHQSTLDEIREEKNIQNEAKDVREMGVTGSSSDNVNITSRQAVQTGTQFRGDIVETNSEQASEGSEHKEAGQDIKSSSMDEKQMSELNISRSHPDSTDEVKESKTIQNEARNIDVANTGILCNDLRGVQIGTGNIGVASHLVINNQNETGPAIKSLDSNEDPKDIREMPNMGQSHSGENFKLGQTVQTETGDLTGPVDTPAYIISQDLRSKEASQIAEQKEASQEIISSSLIEGMISLLNLSEEKKTNSNETREIKELINSGHVHITDRQDAQNEERMPGNTNQSNDNVISESNQDSVDQTSISDENSHVGNGKKGHSSFITSLNSSSHEQASANEGGDASQKQEAVDGQNPDQRRQEQPSELHDHGDSRISETHDIFPTTKTRSVCSPNYPRYGQIITKTVQEMERYLGKEIGKGAFGTVYEANMPMEVKCKFAIKEIRVTEELFQKSYDKEIHHGRILHPFINPIVARAESIPSKLGEGICYLMYPYMKNRELRFNIDIVNSGKNLCPRESNTKIWSRCIYQIAKAVDFLHKPVASVRGPIFHRDLTSRNIFLDENFNVRIGDFGIAVEAKWNSTHATLTKALGTEGYHPPNMNPSEYNASYDVFSVGVVMLEILTGLDARIDEDPHYLFKKYNYVRGYEDLIEDLVERAEENEAVSWNNIPRRDQFAKIALQAVGLDEKQRKTIDLLQKLEEMRLDSGESYRKPENQDRCVSCCVNPTAKLSTKGQDCRGNERNSPCQHFCVLCLMNHHFNPLVCPQHGNTRPPFGDQVYAVFIAGNNVDDTQQYPGWNDPSQDTEVAQMFIRDVQKVAQVLTGKHPFVLGASKDNVKVVVPEKPGTKGKMEAKIKKAFEDLNAAIKQAIQMENLDPEKDRLPNSLFLFYFSGHCSAEDGLYLGSTEETLKASTPWIQEMLHKKLGVDQIVVVLDCCHANSQNFTYTHGLNAIANFEDGRKKASIVQLSSCDVHETSSAKFEGEGHGSYFTHFFCQGLLGLDSVPLKNDTIIFCAECEQQRTDRNAVDITLPCGKYHYQCLSDHGVTFYAMKNFIQGHFQHLRGVTCGPEFMTQVHNAQGEKEIFLAYYNPCKWHIPIHLKGSEASHSVYLNTHPDSMDKLRHDIIKHAIEMKLHSDVLEFHKSYESTVKDSSDLIAIHPRYGSDRDSELISLDSIYKARSCNRELEARVRENVKGISNGPVKLSKLNATMVINSEIKMDDDHLKINQSCIQVAIKYLRDAEESIKKMKQLPSYCHKDLKMLIQEVLSILRNIRTCDSGSLLEKEKKNMLNFYLYKEFSVLAIEAM